VHSIILHDTFPSIFNKPDVAQEVWVIWEIRIPRILMGILAGIGLAIAGTMMQGSLGRASRGNLLPASIMLVGCFIPLMWKSWDVNVMGA